MRTKLFQPTLQEVINYLVQLNLACDVCHHTDWTVYMEPDQKVTVGAISRLLDAPDEESDFHIELTKTTTPVIQVQCKHCGQMKYFALQHVLKAIENDEETKK